MTMRTRPDFCTAPPWLAHHPIEGHINALLSSVAAAALVCHVGLLPQPGSAPNQSSNITPHTQDPSALCLPCLPCACDRLPCLHPSAISQLACIAHLPVFC